MTNAATAFSDDVQVHHGSLLVAVGHRVDRGDTLRQRQRQLHQPSCKDRNHLCSAGALNSCRDGEAYAREDLHPYPDFCGECAPALVAREHKEERRQQVEVFGHREVVAGG